jgi:carboxypeptidase family protein/TonB-dependent receptor-like protein
MRTRHLAAVFSLLCLASSAAAAAAQVPATNAGTVRVTVVDAQQYPVPGATCSLMRAGYAAADVATAATDAAGVAVLPGIPADTYTLRVEIPGFETLIKHDLAVHDSQVSEVRVILEVAAVAESVTISAPASEPASTAVAAGASTPAAVLPRQVIQRLPLATARIDAAFAIIPGVVRSARGEISMKGATEQQSALLVNGLDAADPASGNFRLNLPVDSVEGVQVFLHPYTAEYGQFTGGITRVETRAGGDRWHVELNDFLPDPRIVKGKIVGIADDTPHLNLNGPLVAHRAFLSQSLAYLLLKRPVRGLDFPVNETKTVAYSSFTQLDFTPGARHTDTITVGYFPERNKFVGLDYFRPQPVAPSSKQSDDDVSVRDNYQVGGGLLASAVSYRHFNTDVWAPGTNDYTLTPTVERGSYFASQNRQSRRVEWTEAYTLPSRRLLGSMHETKFGTDVSYVSSRLSYAARPVNSVRADGSLAERTVFDEVGVTFADNLRYVAFVQDRWTVGQNLDIDAGLRYEHQRLADGQTFAPRAGFAWSPTGASRTVIRGGFGLFYDKVPLNIRSFSGYPPRTVTRYGADGNAGVIVDQRRFMNVLIDSGAPGPRDTSPVPRNVTWNIQVDQLVGPKIGLRANLVDSRTGNIYIVEPEIDTLGRSIIALKPSGRSDYRAVELTARLVLAHDRGSVQVSYIGSRSRGDLNDFNSYFGDFGAPLIRPNQVSRLPFDVPHRLLALGTIALPRRISVAPIFEIRSGFPYSVLDEDQNFVGVRNNSRFPHFVALDAEVAKEFQISKKYGIRVSVRGFNVINHFNPRDVRANLGDPGFGRFFASYRTYFTGGFDIIY